VPCYSLDHDPSFQDRSRPELGRGIYANCVNGEILIAIPLVPQEQQREDSKDSKGMIESRP
jgi:hypothetical protein